MKSTQGFTLYEEGSDDIYSLEAIGPDEAIAEAYAREYFLIFEDTSPVTIRVNNLEELESSLYKFYVLKEGGFRCELVSKHPTNKEPLGFKIAKEPKVVFAPEPGKIYDLKDFIPTSCMEVLFFMDDGSVKRGLYSKGLSAKRWVYVVGSGAA